MHANVASRVAIVAFVAVGALGGHDSSSSQGAIPPLRIDAVVTDPQGHAIPNLGASDFEVREDASSRPVSAAEFRWVPRHSTIEVRPIETGVDEERAARQPGTRVFAFFLDEFHVSPGTSADRVRDSVASFLDEKVYERDLAAVIRPLDSVRSVRFRRDRSVLHGSIAGFSARKRDYSPRTDMEAEQVGRDAVTVKAARERIVRAGLKDLGVRLGELNADRAVIVLVSEGFPSDADLLSLVRSASRFHFSIYTFNPADPRESGTHASSEEARDNSTLEWLATQTGGHFTRADAFIAGFARLYHETQGFYALTYQPAYADGRFHGLEVRARRAARVRAHASYWATERHERSEPTSYSAIENAGGRRQLRRSAWIDAWIGVRHGSAESGHMAITWEPRTDQARQPRSVDVRVRSATRTVFEGTIGPVAGGGSANAARFEVPTGRVEVDLTVLDAAGTVLDTDARDFDVPDFRSSGKAGPVLLPIEVVRVRIVRDLRSASVNSNAVPSAERTFARGDHLLIRVPAFDPTGTAVQATARILSRSGQLMRGIESTDVTLGAGLTQFVLPLYWLAPGPYQIEITGTNANGSAKQRFAIQVQ